MKNRALLLISLALLTAVANLPVSSYAQSYSTIDGELGLYCADLPNGTNTLVRLDYKKGLTTINVLDPDEQKANIVKLRKKIQRRINTLKQMQDDYDPFADQAKLSQIYKFVANEVINELDSSSRLEGLEANKIYKKIGALISQLRNRLADLEYSLETIDRCLRDEDLIPPPESVSAEVITFPFRHPDYGTIEWMRGLGVTGILHKKRYYGTVCVSTSKVHSTISKFPKESIRTLQRNPCLMFWQRTFRNYPFCHFGAHQDSAVGWFSTTSAGFSQSAVDQDELESLEGQLSFYAPINVRAPTKKKPCRTKG